ncbi:hypothetical protein OUZ56_027520 [Daphnia magna]|uniref:FHA domain-containing protein n=1 Tax=Daphnia magna TaxID=35525 RepID=A0ABQ9ZQ03_9CRUS|nr:hypothetical protein OUZ56_027520 [Daphnia magna]
MSETDSDCNYGLLSPFLSRAALLVLRPKNYHLLKASRSVIAVEQQTTEYVLLDLNSSKRHCTIGQDPNGRCIENVGPLLMNFQQHSSTRRTCTELSGTKLIVDGFAVDKQGKDFFTKVDRIFYSKSHNALTTNDTDLE